MATVSVYSDWVTYPTASASRLARLRLYIKDIQDQLQSAGKYAIEGREVDIDLIGLQKNLQDLMKEEKHLSEQVGLGDGTFQGWTSGRARL